MLTVTLVALLALQPDDAVLKPADVVLKPDIAWAGTLPHESLRAAAPESGVITDNAGFTALWEAWRPGEKQPEIDFAKTLVVVGTIDGPNRMFVSLNNDDGNLTTQFGGTKIGGPGFGYIIAAVNRTGIERVNDRPLPKTSTEPAPAPTKPERPQRRPRPTPPAAEPDARPAARGSESIRVAVRGRLETGIVAIGGETTGTVIRSKGLMFEVALDRPELKEKAEALNGQSALVAGELVVKEGVETGTRLIIDADRVDLVRLPRR